MIKEFQGEYHHHCQYWDAGRCYNKDEKITNQSSGQFRGSEKSMSYQSEALQAAKKEAPRDT